MGHKYRRSGRCRAKLIAPAVEPFKLCRNHSSRLHSQQRSGNSRFRPLISSILRCETAPQTHQGEIRFQKSVPDSGVCIVAKAYSNRYPRATNIHNGAISNIARARAALESRCKANVEEESVEHGEWVIIQNHASTDSLDVLTVLWYQVCALSRKEEEEEEDNTSLSGSGMEEREKDARSTPDPL